MQTVVELEGVNGELFTLAGPDQGDKGIYLSKGSMEGLYDADVKVTYEEPGNYPGSRYLGHRILRRDIVFAVDILNDAESGGLSWLARDSEWRKAWAYDRDCKLYFTTDSGTRYLKLRLGNKIVVSMVTDPNGEQINRAIMDCIAGDPFWYEDDVIFTATTVTDTTFTPTILPWPWPQHAIPKETLEIVVDDSDHRGGLNPTDQPIFPKWIVPGSTEEPSEPYIPLIPWLGAPESPATIWTIPDYSFEDPDLADRRIRMPGLIGGLKTDEVQRIIITGDPTGGTWTLDFDGDLTSNIAYNASANTVRDALIALPSITSGDVSVTKDDWTYEVWFKDDLSGAEIPTMVADYSDLTGGTYPFIDVQVKTEGFTSPAEDCVIDTDPRVEQVTSASGSQVWARMNGVRFRHPIPPYTAEKTFEITVSGTIPGQMVTLRLPRAWTRPWGLE